MLTPEERSAIERDMARGTASIEQMEKLEHEHEEEFKHRLMRMHAIGCDDGKGWCKYCGSELLPCGDALGHPMPLCEGPPARCSACGGTVERDEHGRLATHACPRSVAVVKQMELREPRRPSYFDD